MSMPAPLSPDPVPARLHPVDPPASHDDATDPADWAAVAAAAARDGSTALDMTSQLRYARDIVRIEGQALLNLSRRLNGNLCLAVTALFDCRSSVIVTGMGKAGLIGQKIAATLASTGTRSHFLHPAEAFHGDLGRIHRDDVVLLLSQSGETDEVTQLLPSLAQLGVTTIAITGKATSTLGHAASIVLELGPLQEACALGLAPSTSTTAMLAVGDALALVTSRMRNFQPADFARFHPGGSLGRQLSRVDDFMRPLDECRVAEENQTVREVLQRRRVAARRSGAIMITDAGGRLTGFFTDSDLARLFESRRNEALDGPIGEVMTADPVTVPVGAMISDALDILAERKISELPVLDPDGKTVGLVDITDLLARGLDVGERRAASSPAAAAAPEADRPTAAPRSSVPRPNFLDEMHGRAAENA